MTASSGNVLTVVVTVVLVLIAIPLLWGGLMMSGMMGPGMMGGWGGAAQPGWGPVAMLFWLLTLVGVGLLAVWAIRRVSPREDYRRGPLDILKERYARGELTREQYEQMRQDLA
jgi:putative membrane protein